MHKSIQAGMVMGVRALVVAVMVFGSLIATALQPAPIVEAVPLIGIGLNAPAQVPIGGAVNFTVSFDNTAPNAPGNTGYGPFIDLYFPVEGVDGDGAAVDDGIDFVSATYLGLPVTATQLTFPGPGPTGCVNHPYAVAPMTGAPLQVCGPTGDKLVVLQLPFGSFTPDQPAAVVSVQATLSNLADLGAPLTIRARGGYRYGATPTNDWCCPPFDATILSITDTNSQNWTPASAVTPALLALTKTYTGPEDETATGPNFPRRYTLTATWPNGQPITNLLITDTLPNNLAFASVISTTPGGGVVTQTPTVGAAANPPNNDLAVTWPVTLTSGSATVVFEYFVPLTDAVGARVLNANSGDDAVSPDNAEASGGWDPIDGRDPVTPTAVSVGTIDHTLNDKSIAIQKSVTPAIVAPGSTLTYTLDFQVSDFFAFNSVVISDTFSDGQRWDSTFTPTLLLNGNAYTLTIAAMNAANFTVDVSEIGNDPNPATDGSTTVTFRVSDETITRGEDGRLVGGCVDEANGSATPDCAIYNDGPTTGTLIFRTVVQDQFSDTYPSGDPSVDHGDVLDNAVTVTGAVLDTATFAPTGQSESDTSGAGVSIIFGVLSKSVYAVNGSTTLTTPVRVRPDDTVTYRLTYSLPTSDYEDLIITDYLPLPIFAASEVTVFSDTVSAAPPPAGAWKFGPTETFRALAGNGVGCPIAGVGDGTPCLTVDANSNSLAFSYGDFDDPANTDTVIDLLFTVTVSDDPFADGLFLTNQANAVEGTTNAGSQTLDGIVQIQLTEPVLTTTKGIVATSNPNNVFNPSPNAPVTFTAPGTAGPRWAGVINSTNIATTAINSNVSGVDSGDLVSFAIMIVNSGTSTRGAFDVTITDTLPAGFIVPAGGLNLRVSHGDPGSVLGFTGLGGGPDSIANTPDDIFGGGLVINDPGPNQGACQAHDATNGLNIVIITYDLQLDPSVTPLQNIVNTASLTNYAGTEGGPNHLPQPQTDSATTTIANIAVGKSLISTSEAHTTGTRVAVGEIVRYQLTVTLIEGTLPNIVVTDTLPNGLTFLNDGTATLAFIANGGAPITSTALSGAGLAVSGNSSVVTPTFVIPGSAITPGAFSTGTDPVFNLGTLLNSDTDSDNEYAVIQFNAIADNSAAGSNDAGDNRNNAFSVRVGSNSPVTSSNVRVTIAEPALTINKTAAPTSADAGDTITYTVTINNASGANNSTAFETVITDALPALMNLNLGSLTISTGGGVTNTANLSAGNTITVTAEAIAPGGSLTLTYQATVDTAVGSGQVITNTATALFTSLPLTGTVGNPTGSDTPDPSGGTNGERNGSGTPAHNDHRVSDPATVTVTVTPVKTLVATSEAHTSGSNVAVGEITRYRLAVALPESTALNLQLRDNLPAGLRFLDDGTATVVFICNGGANCITSSTLSGAGLLISGSAPVTPTTALPGAAIGGGPFGSGTVVTFSLGDVTNTDNDADQEFVVVEFNALTENVAGNQAGTALNNTFTVRVNGADVATSAPLTVTVVEPNLLINKTVAPTSGDAGDTVTYTVQLSHPVGGNASTGFETVFTDVVPSDLVPNFGSVSVLPAGGASGVNVFSAGNAITITVDVFPPGGAVTLTAQASLSGTVTPGQIITNTGTATTTSLPGAGTSGNPTGSVTPGGGGATDGERNGDGGVNDYRVTDPASVSVPNPTLSKALVATSAAHTAGSNVVIGEIISYALTIALPEGTTPSLVVTDAVPSGLAYVSGSGVLDVTGFGGTVGAGEPAAASAGGNGDDVAFSFASPITVTADNNVGNNTFTLRLALRVLNVAGNQDATVLPNSATMNAGSGTQTSNTVNATVREPVLTVSKTVDDATPNFGQVLTYTLTLTHSAASTADALDLALTDTLPSGLTLVSGSASIAPGGTVTESAGSLVVSVPSLALGNGATITYRATVGFPPTVNFGSALTNAVAVQWTSLPGGDPEERTGAGGVNDYNTGTTRAVTVSNVDLQITKTDGGAATTPGGLVTYTLTITNSGNITATGVLITDTVPANTSFDSAGNGGTESGGVVSWPAFSLGANASVVRTVTFRVDNPLPAGVSVITNTAFVRDDGANGADPTPPNNTSTDATPITGGRVDLQLSKDDGVSNVTPGQTLTYTLVITNVGNVAASGVRITDTLPANVTFVNASNGGTHASGVVSWPAFTLNGGGASVTRTVSVQVNNPLPAGVTAITNTAVVTDDGASGADPTPADNSDSDTDTLAVSLDLRLTKRAGAAGAAPGDVLVYTLTYTNVGDVAAAGVIITETVPADTTFNAAGSAPSVWSCADGSAAGTTCTLTVGMLAGGNAGGSVRFAARIDPALSPSVTQINNTALISDDGASGADPTPADNDDDASTPIVPPTAVTLLYFRIGSVAVGNVVLEWATAAEVDSFGFKLYRSASNDFGAATEIAFVAATSNNSSYAHTDAPGSGNWWYWLADVDTNAHETPHGPITTAIGIGESQVRVYLPLVQR